MALCHLEFWKDLKNKESIDFINNVVKNECDFFRRYIDAGIGIRRKIVNGEKIFEEFDLVTGHTLKG